MEDIIELGDAEKDQRLRNIASLARLVSYARQSARELNAEFSVYCLDLALGALLQDLAESGITLPVEETIKDAPAGPVH
ncbi:hypothetical protein GCM10010520_29170 [Rhizobium viscosum]|uniref:Uncharacterized protein n=1 Tax=Rhizobium viscosum TaxID=1673 RepID=A0ABR9J0P5_RHIVS|nr:hypothetical protein [Rhizobium viscosum]MBE1509015.1 hypothetical protein [Rhizobium viscosum]